MDNDKRMAVAWIENNISSIVGDLVNSDPDVCDMIAESGACGWGLEGFEPVTAFTIEPNRYAFVIAVNLSADRNPNRFCMFDKAKAGLGGTVHFNGDWKLDSIEVLSLTRDDG